MHYTEEQVKTIEGKLKSKVSSTRQRIISILLAADEQLIECYKRIQKLKSPDIQGSLSELREASPALGKAFEAPISQEAGQSMKVYPGEEGGFGLYKPSVIEMPEMQIPLTKVLTTH